MRLIDADRLKDTLGVSDRDIEFAEMLDEQPTVDAEPVRHGKWLCTDDLYEVAYCSECKYDADEPWGLVIERFKYCPNCGAKMDAQEAEE